MIYDTLRPEIEMPDWRNSLKPQKQLLITGLTLVLIIVFARALAAQQDETIYDKDINVTFFEDMRYPPIAREANIQGIVVVRVKINDAGKVTSAVAISGAELLVPEALSNAKKWQFRPNPRKAEVIIYEFRMADGQCDSQQDHLSVFRNPNVVSVIGCREMWQPSKN